MDTSEHRILVGLTDATTRRGMLRGLAGGVLGVAVAAEAADARRGRRKRKRPGAGRHAGRRWWEWRASARAGGGDLHGLQKWSRRPSTSIQAAINAARAGATITVCDGAYKEVITINKNLTLAAAAGAEVKVDGSRKGSVVTVPQGVTAGLQGLEITDGGSTSHGGAIFNQGNLTLTNLLIQDNQAREGAGIYNDLGAQLRLHDTIVQENDATNSGGGIYNLGDTHGDQRQPDRRERGAWLWWRAQQFWGRGHDQQGERR